jgi:hypothetical protein
LQIVEHRKQHIIEVVYPGAALTALQHADYTIRIKQVVEKQRGAWGLLVDQRALSRLDDKLKDKMLALYTFATKKGMTCSARLVNSSVEALRLSDWVRGTELRSMLRVFTERQEAFEWLSATLRAASA